VRFLRVFLGHLVIARLVVDGREMVVLGRLVMMLGRADVMLGRMVFHWFSSMALRSQRAVTRS
jgi:hypothetical protein